jgi:hypothetical protein
MSKKEAKHPDFNSPGKPPRLTGRKSTIVSAFPSTEHLLRM